MKYKLDCRVTWVRNISSLSGRSGGAYAGGKNMVECGYASFIGGGDWNCIYPAGGGYRLYRSFIGGGNQNTINVASAGGPIGTNGIMMGDHNEITGESIFSGIAAGGNNTINNGYASFIGGGDSSCIQSAPGGANICRSFIGGGNFNCIFDSLATIGGGDHNVINAGAPNSFIGGGNNNTVSGPCSAILGGQNNNDGGLANVHIVGSGIAAVNPNTLHVNALWAGAIPGPFPAVPALAPGTVYFGPAGVPGGKVLYIV